MLTPTYHVFDIYKRHQNATLLDSFVETPVIEGEEYSIPSIHQSASIDEHGKVHITIANLSATNNQSLQVHIQDKENVKVEAVLLSGAMDAHNTFDNPTMVSPMSYTKHIWENGLLHVDIPFCSVVALTLE